MKNSYILLRNNKESNSLSIEELQKIGLRKTDLIWVECQSMAWRSPTEIAELKNLVSAGDNNETRINKEKPVLKESSTLAKLVKHQKSGELMTEPETKDSEKQGTLKRVIFSENESKKMDSHGNTGSSPWGTITEEQPPVARKKLQTDTKSFSLRLPGQLKKIALYLGLIILGSLLTLVIQKLVSKKSVALKQELPLSEKMQPKTDSNPIVSNKDNTIAATTSGSTYLLTKEDSVSTKKEQKKPVVALQNISNTTGEISGKTDSSNNDNTEDSQVAAEKNIKTVSIEDISSKISLKTNDYHVGLFGGIKDLTLTIQNNSKYMLDKVNVELKYLNKKDKIIDTEKVSFQNVYAGYTQDIPVNKSKRGVKVVYQITHIECKALSSNQ